MSRPGATILLTCLLLICSTPIFAQTDPILHYTLTIDSTDLSGYDVSIRIEHAPPSFHLAMATHPEYDDRYWRFVTGFSTHSTAAFSHTDSAVWTITGSSGESTISYRIHLPPSPPLHFSHRPFLKPYGGLVGDLHSFMYLVENPDATCRLTLRLPQGWISADGLDFSSFPLPHTSHDAHASELEFPPTTASRLLDAPILIGKFHRWSFSIAGKQHAIAYLPYSSTNDFDGSAFIPNLHKIVDAAQDIFKSFPYDNYCFLFEDSSAGALEHGNSVTIGATPADISTPKRSGIYEEIIHEFFHSWNGMSITPEGFTPLNFGPQQSTTGLWFTEGFTMFYADLIARRTGLPTEDSTRIAHLTHLITRYYSDTGNTILPPAKVSLADYAQPGPLGDFSASTHLQGELLAACLDILIRDATWDQRTLDDVLREVFLRCGNKQPFTAGVLEAAAASVCKCDEVHSFFRNYVAEGKPIDFAVYLNRLGLKFQHDQPPALDAQGRPLPDTRVYSWILRDDTSLRIGITNPNGCWAKAGLHTGDIITAINGRPTTSRRDFQTVLLTLHVGDTANITTQKKTGTTIVPVYITGYTIPLITITQGPAPTSKQRQILRDWAWSGPFSYQ